MQSPIPATPSKQTKKRHVKYIMLASLAGVMDPAEAKTDDLWNK
jgi:hypothetical protein